MLHMLTFIYERSFLMIDFLIKYITDNIMNFYIETLKIVETSDLSFMITGACSILLFNTFFIITYVLFSNLDIRIFLIENKKRFKLCILNFLLLIIYIHVVQEISISEYISYYHTQDILFMDVFLCLIIGIIVFKQTVQILNIFSMMFEPFIFFARKDITYIDNIYKKKISNIISEFAFLIALYASTYTMKEHFIFSLIFLLFTSTLDKKIEDIIIPNNLNEFSSVGTN